MVAQHNLKDASSLVQPVFSSRSEQTIGSVYNANYSQATNLLLQRRKSLCNSKDKFWVQRLKEKTEIPRNTCPSFGILYQLRFDWWFVSWSYLEIEPIVTFSPDRSLFRYAPSRTSPDNSHRHYIPSLLDTSRSASTQTPHELVIFATIQISRPECRYGRRSSLDIPRKLGNMRHKWVEYGALSGRANMAV